ncbi:MAG: hypothetical protein ABJL67_14950 [Sulfitobacter sp.]
MTTVHNSHKECAVAGHQMAISPLGKAETARSSFDAQTSRFLTPDPDASNHYNWDGGRGAFRAGETAPHILPGKTFS